VPLIRSTNTGVSCFIDPNGRITSETRLDDAEALIEDVPMMEGGTVYRALGDWPGYLCLLAVALFWWTGRRKKIKKNK
jgi:apolipoprotein N-acyltransferase